MTRDNDFTLFQLVSMLYLGLIERNHCLNIISKFIRSNECSVGALVLSFSLTADYNAKFDAYSEDRIIQIITKDARNKNFMLLYLLRDAYYSFTECKYHDNVMLLQLSGKDI